MKSRRRGWLMGALMAIAATPGLARAEPECGWFWNRSPDCPRSAYSIFHYWAPGYYQVRAQLHDASRLDQYAPGPSPLVAPSYEIDRYKCRAIPPAPLSPYADPEGYYGRPVAPRE